MTSISIPRTTGFLIFQFIQKTEGMIFFEKLVQVVDEHKNVDETALLTVKNPRKEGQT